MIPTVQGRRNTMPNMVSGPEPRYTYAKPTERPMPGMPKNHGTDINNYGLPAIDVQTQRRNFPGYTEANYFSLDEMRMGDYSGNTETDSTFTEDETNERAIRAGYLQPRPEQAGKGYTRINLKSGGPGRNWKTSSPKSKRTNSY